MENSERFWLSLWTIVGVFLLLVIAMTVVRRATYDKHYLEALSKSSAPIGYACAVDIKAASPTSPVTVLCVDKARK